MKDKKIVKDLDLFNYILQRPAMFSIKNIEDFYIFFKGYLFGKRKNILSDYLDNFNNYVIDNFSKEYFNEFSYEKIIRLHSINDLHSLELLNQLVTEFNRTNLKQEDNLTKMPDDTDLHTVPTKRIK